MATHVAGCMQGTLLHWGGWKACRPYDAPGPGGGLLPGQTAGPETRGTAGESCATSAPCPDLLWKCLYGVVWRDLHDAITNDSKCTA